MKAIRIHQFGGPEVLKYEDVNDPAPQADQVLIEVKTAGVNYIDIYFRNGIYEVPLPVVLGLEASGVVIDFGKGVKGFRKGDRVAYTGVLGSYAQRVAVTADRVVKIPDQLSFRDGACAMVQGITAQYLTTSTYAIKKGEHCLIHAAAGGVGLLLCQLAKLKGAIVIGTVSTEEKAKLARRAGADHVILYTEKDFAAEVRRLTDNKGVHVVYDGVGASTFIKGLDCLMPRGMMVLFGQASGVVPPLDLNVLNRKGSLYVTRPGINAYIRTHRELMQRANEVFEWIIQKKMTIHIGEEFPLAKAQEAHKALEGRKTTGKILLTVD